MERKGWLIREMAVVAVAITILWSTVGQAAEFTLQEVYERAAPAVVMVMGYSSSGEGGSGGTGSIIRRDGLVLTNAHVVVEEKTGKPYPNVYAYLKPDRVTGNPKTDLSRGSRATVRAFSTPLDLALLKIDNLPAPVPTLELGDSRQVRIGDRVAAIGHPEQGGLWTLTTGVVSAEFEDFTNIKGKHVIQTETGLNRGNSGGPLLNAQGSIIAVNTAIARLAPDGMPITSISFAVKAGVAQKWLREQGVVTEVAARPTEPMGTESTAAPEAPKAPAEPATPKSGVPSQPKPSAPEVHTPVRPYDMDQLISERRQALAEMEGLMNDMREGMRSKFRR